LYESVITFLRLAIIDALRTALSILYWLLRWGYSVYRLK